MARRGRPRGRTRYRTNVVVLPGGTVAPKSEPTVAGAVIICFVTVTLLYALTISVGPVIDFFSNYMLLQAGNPYATPVLELLPWTYLFILLGVGVAFIVVWRTVFRTISYEWRDQL